MTQSDMMRGMAMRHKMMGWVLNLLNEMGIPLKDGCNGITCRGVFTFRIVDIGMQKHRGLLRNGIGWNWGLPMIGTPFSLSIMKVVMTEAHTVVLRDCHVGCWELQRFG